MGGSTRRSLLILAAVAPFAALAGRGSAQSPAACYDPAALTFSQKSRRRSLGYVEASADAKNRFGLCSFFTAAKDGCGACQLLAGGPVNAGALCNSFAPKA